jgi:CMP-N,N'-diacetyllegionaminic acid synthase
MQITALLTGRGNNTLKDKNILPLLGKPVLYYPAMAAKCSDKISHFFVSSDCERILAAAKDCGYEEIVRPRELSMPSSQHHDVLIHALNTIRQRGHEVDILVVLLANSPTVLTSWIDNCIEILERNPKATAVVPVTLDMDHHPFRAKRLADDGSLRSFFDFAGKNISTNRQDLPECYVLCHNFWMLRVNQGLLDKAGEPPWSFMGPCVLPYVVEESIDIHDINDIARAEKWLIKHDMVR